MASKSRKVVSRTEGNYSVVSVSGGPSTTSTGKRVNASDGSNVKNESPFLKVSHKNFLNAELDDGKGVKDFEVYLKEEFKSNPPIKLYVDRHVRGRSRADVYSVTQHYRRIIRHILKSLGLLHDTLNQACDGFSTKNLAIKNGTVMFRPLKPVAATQETMNEDFKCLSDVIRNDLLKGYRDSQIPPDMLDLIQRLPFCDSVEDGKWLIKHPAVLSSKKQVSLFKDAFDKRHYLVDQIKIGLYRDAVTTMRPRRGWFSTFSKNDHFQAVLECLGTDVYDDQSGSYTENFEFLRCCRNLTTHLKEHMHPRDTSDVTDFDVDCIISSVFIDGITDFHRRLYRMGILECFFS